MSFQSAVPRIDSPRLLVIDDDDLVRRNICGFLRDSGFSIIEAANGAVGVSLFNSEKPDLVLCDLRMPDVDGLDVIRNVANKNSNTPVIVISGLGEIDDVVQALRLGASDYLIKPIKDLAVLEHSVRNGLKQAELISENEQYSSQLEDTNMQLRQSLDLLRVDQQAGRLVQTRLLPVTPFRSDHFECRHKIVPSLYLSGDFVDYWRTENGRLIFYIADVSGHGASSAFVTVLLMYLAKDIVRRLQRKNGGLTASAVLMRLNKELSRANLQKHVTAFIGILDPDSNSLQYAAAGHYPMPIVGDGANFNYLECRSLPIGIKEETVYEECQIQLGNDFTINLFSDGVLELINLPDLEAKESRLLDIVKQANGRFDGVSKGMELSAVADAPDDVALLTVAVAGNR